MHHTPVPQCAHTHLNTNTHTHEEGLRRVGRTRLNRLLLLLFQGIISGHLKQTSPIHIKYQEKYFLCILFCLKICSRTKDTNPRGRLAAVQQEGLAPTRQATSSHAGGAGERTEATARAESPWARPLCRAERCSSATRGRREGGRWNVQKKA